MHTGHVLTLYGRYLVNAQDEFAHQQVNVSLNKKYGHEIEVHSSFAYKFCILKHFSF